MYNLRGSRPAFHRRRRAQVAPGAHLHGVMLLLLLVEHNRFDAGRARGTLRTALVRLDGRRPQRPQAAVLFGGRPPVLGPSVLEPHLEQKTERSVINRTITDRYVATRLRRFNTQFYIGPSGLIESYKPKFL